MTLRPTEWDHREGVRTTDQSERMAVIAKSIVDRMLLEDDPVRRYVVVHDPTIEGPKKYLVRDRCKETILGRFKTEKMAKEWVGLLQLRLWLWLLTRWSWRHVLRAWSWCWAWRKPAGKATPHGDSHP